MSGSEFNFVSVLTYVVLALLVIGIVSTLYFSWKTKKLRFIIPSVVLFVFFSYSFFTTSGAIRLRVALEGEVPTSLFLSIQDHQNQSPKDTYFNVYLKENVPFKSDTDSITYEIQRVGFLKIAKGIGFM